MALVGLTLPRLGTGRTGSRSAGLAAATTVLAAAAAAVTVAGLLALARSVRRVEVTGASMAPALLAGDRLVVIGRPWGLPAWPEVGQVVAVHDPRQPERILIKRVGSVDRVAGAIGVAGDAADSSTDSRTFGAVPRASIVGRAIYRYAPSSRSGPVPRAGEYHSA